MKKYYSILIFFIFLFTGSNAAAQALTTHSGNGNIQGHVSTSLGDPVSNVQAVLTNPLTGTVFLSWDCNPSAGFLNYRIERNDLTSFFTSDSTFYSDILPTYGIYQYCVYAVYSDGISAPSCIDIEWPNPTLNLAPAALVNTQFPNVTENVPLTLSNTGQGTLSFEFPDYSDQPMKSPLAYCAATSSMCDEFIGRVQFGTLDHSSACDNYGDFTAFSTGLMAMTSTPIVVTGAGNVYAQDLAYVWIDYNHNETFDPEELTTLTTLGGGTSFSGNIMVPLSAIPGITRMRIRVSYNAAANPCGTQPYGEVEDYSVNIQSPSFITAVSPVSGTIASGASLSISVQFSSTGPNYVQYGVYNTTLNLNTNDVNQSTVAIPATMIVGIGSLLQGTITDYGNTPLNDVMLQAGSFSTLTNDSGDYTLNLDAGTYNLIYSKTGYDTLVLQGIALADGTTTLIDTSLSEIPYPPSCACASVNFEDTQCTVSWCIPSGAAGMNFENENSTVPSNITSVVGYRLSRISNFDPTQPVSTGTYTLLATNLPTTLYVESGSTWNSLPQGYYAYGIQSVYPNGQLSEYTFTNIVANSLYANLTINAQLQCGSVPAAGAIVNLTGACFPYYTINDTLPTSGNLVMNNILSGEYTLTITSPGCQAYTSAISLDSNLTVNALISPVAWPPRNLYVDGNTILATWNEPLAILLDEDFESGVFPPTGWQVSSDGVGWFGSTDGSSSSWTVPPHTAYAVANDDLAGPTNNGCCDYLVTPELNLTTAPSYYLTFSSFFSGEFGQSANLEMSTDGGNTWTSIYSCNPSIAWSQQEVDLTAYSGINGLSSVKLAFHTDDKGAVGSGWAVDDINLYSGNLPVESYTIMVDSIIIDNVPAGVLYYEFDPASMECGQNHTACVAATYCGVPSDYVCDTFMAAYMGSPINFTVQDSVTAVSGAAILDWNAPIGCTSYMVGYNIYRNDSLIYHSFDTISEYRDLNLDPGSYCYELTSIYDLTPFGFPGLYGESILVGPECISIVYGAMLPVNEDFSSGVFDTTMWNVGMNWLVDEDSDNPVPAAKFKWDPLMVDYSSALESMWINATLNDSINHYALWFDYDIKLVDQALSSTEKLSIEVWNGLQWSIVREYPNTGSFDWIHQHLDITSLSIDRAFKIRFRANGATSDAIHYWAVDNIQVYKVLLETLTDLTKGKPIHIFPNPANRFVQIDLPEKIRSLMVFDATGSLVVSKDISNETRVRLDTHSYSPGVYFLNFIGINGEISSCKLVIMH